jgi:hypothetical protein
MTEASNGVGMSRKWIGEVLAEKGHGGWQAGGRPCAAPAHPEASSPDRFDVSDDFEIDEEALPLTDELLPAAAASSLHDDMEFLFGAGAGADPVRRLEARVQRLAQLLEAKGLCGRRELELALGMPSQRSGNA